MNVVTKEMIKDVGIIFDSVAFKATHKSRSKSLTMMKSLSTLNWSIAIAKSISVNV